MFKKLVKLSVFIMVLFIVASCQSKTSYAVVFKDVDGQILKTEVVAHGQSASPPQTQEKEGMVFAGWDIRL